MRSSNRVFPSALLVVLLGACSPSKRADDVCAGAPSSTRFEVWIGEAVLLPFKPDGNPWDWDGTVPAGLLQAVGTLSGVVQDILGSGLIPPDPNLITAAEILALTDEILQATNQYAPGLLAATVPPDPYGQIFVERTDGEFYDYGWSETALDTYHPRVNTRWSPVEVLDGEVLHLDLYDEDLAVDDYIGTLVLSAADARAIGGCGPMTFVAPDPTFPIQLARFEVRPLD